MSCIENLTLIIERDEDYCGLTITGDLIDVEADPISFIAAPDDFELQTKGWNYLKLDRGNLAEIKELLDLSERSSRIADAGRLSVEWVRNQMSRLGYESTFYTIKEETV